LYQHRGLGALRGFPGGEPTPANLDVAPNPWDIMRHQGIAKFACQLASR